MSHQTSEGESLRFLFSCVTVELELCASVLASGEMQCVRYGDRPWRISITSGASWFVFCIDAF